MSNKELLKALDEVSTSFVYEHTKYTCDFKLKNYLEKMFDTKFEKVFVSNSPQVDTKSLNVGCLDIIILKKNGRVLQLTNSEWGYFQYLN